MKQKRCKWPGCGAEMECICPEGHRTRQWEQWDRWCPVCLIVCVEGESQWLCPNVDQHKDWTCSDCEGWGRVIPGVISSDDCSRCGGVGTICRSEWGLPGKPKVLSVEEPVELKHFENDIEATIQAETERANKAEARILKINRELVRSELLRQGFDKVKKDTDVQMLTEECDQLKADNMALLKIVRKFYIKEIGDSENQPVFYCSGCAPYPRSRHYAAWLILYTWRHYRGVIHDKKCALASPHPGADLT